MKLDMKPETKLDKRSKTTSKNFDVSVISKNLSLFEFSANLEHSGGRIPDTESAIMFSVIVTFCLTKTENRTKKPLTQLSHYCFE